MPSSQSRYKEAVILKDNDGKRYYRPTVVRGIPLKDTDRFIYPVDGDRFDTLAQMTGNATIHRGIYEDKQTNYNNEENLLFEVKSEVRNLIGELEKSEIKINEDETQ